MRRLPPPILLDSGEVREAPLTAFSTCYILLRFLSLHKTKKEGTQTDPLFRFVSTEELEPI
jgi:hypothetical protein